MPANNAIPSQKAALAIAGETSSVWADDRLAADRVALLAARVRAGFSTPSGSRAAALTRPRLHAARDLDFVAALA